MHRCTQRLDTQQHRGVEIVIVWVAERRGVHHGSGRAALVMVVEQLWEPLVIQDAIDVLRLLLRGREELAIVVVADVFLVEARQAHKRARPGVAHAHVPVGHQVVAVRIGVHEEGYDVVQKPHRLGVGAAGHLVHHLGELLRAEGFRGVQTTIDPDDGLAFLRQRPCAVVRETLRLGETLSDLSIAFEVAMVLRRGHDRHQLVAPLGGLAHHLQVQARRLPFEGSPITADLLIVGQEIVIAEVGPKGLSGRCDVHLRRERRNGQRCDEQRGGQGENRQGSEGTAHHQAGLRAHLRWSYRMYGPMIALANGGTWQLLRGDPDAIKTNGRSVSEAQRRSR